MRNKVLIVDDVELNRDILSDMLSPDYDILTASDGRQAINIMNSEINNIATVLLDLVMQEVDGFYVLNIMKERDWMKDIPVVIISGDATVEVETRALKFGVNDFIHKPFNVNVVRQRIKNITDLYNYRKQVEERFNTQTDILEKTNILLRRQAYELHQNNARIIDILGTVVESRNLESGQHIHRVKGYTQLLALEYMKLYPESGMTKKQAQLIASASALHDIGKIAIPDSILLKPGRFTQEEFEIMTSHTSKGADIVKEMSDIWDEEYGKVCYEICLYHHERWDGKGYPKHIKEDEIPIAAQLVSIADVYDALVSERCYKDAFTPSQAYEMIINGECGQFNPKLIECFKNLKDVFENFDAENLLLETDVPDFLNC